MYFPYLRGKQFELLAVRELAPMIGGSNISPVIEPVKERTNSLNRALVELINNNASFTVIVNPSVGELAENYDPIFASLTQNIPHNYDRFNFGVIVDNRAGLQAINNSIDQLGFETKRITLIHQVARDPEQEIHPFTVQEVIVNLTDFSLRRYDRKLQAGTVVILEDKFLNRSPNSKYHAIGPELFSEEHNFFEQEGSLGFSDFVTIGKGWTDGGFQPYAVCIHLTYLDNNRIMVRHFTSDSNEDADDVAGKFAEALEKLTQFVNQANINTEAAHEFRRLHEAGHYPGLGTIKKLSIQNHLELITQVV